jgi:hypothetical protein
MKKYIFLFSLFVGLFAFQNAYSQCGTLLDVCHGKLDNARFLKSWPIQLPQQGRGETLPQVSFKMPLTSGTTYKIFACNAEELPGKVIISIRNHNDDLVITSYLVEQKRHLPMIMFPVGMSGIYTFSFYFEEGKEGCAVGVVSSVN